MLQMCKKRNTSKGTSSDVLDHSVLHRIALLPALQGLREQGIFTDCHLEIRGKKIPCHRLVLAICSPVLKAMLLSGMKESQRCTIPIDEFSAEIMEAIVK